MQNYYKIKKKKKKKKYSTIIDPIFTIVLHACYLVKKNKIDFVRPVYHADRSCSILWLSMNGPLGMHVHASISLLKLGRKQSKEGCNVFDITSIHFIAASAWSVTCMIIMLSLVKALAWGKALKTSNYMMLLLYLEPFCACISKMLPIIQKIIQA